MNILDLLDGNFFIDRGSNTICCFFRREVSPDRLAVIKLYYNPVNFRERLLNTLNRITGFNPIISLSDLNIRITENPNTGNRNVKSIYYRLLKMVDVYNVNLGNEEHNMVFRDEFTNVITSILTTGWWPESYNVTRRLNAERSIPPIDLIYYEHITNIEQEQKFKDYMHGDALIDRINNCAELCGSVKEIPIVIRSKDFTAKITDTSIEENVLYIDIEIDGSKEKEEKEESRPRKARVRRTVREDSVNTLREEPLEIDEEHSENEGEENAITVGNNLHTQIQRDVRRWGNIDPSIYGEPANSWRTISINSTVSNETITSATSR